jgi:hypothetical protein
MKNIEKIAIDTILSQFISKNGEIINHFKSAKAAVELAQQNFKKSASPLMSMAHESATVLLQDDVSEEAIKYYEERVTEITSIPFKIKN